MIKDAQEQIVSGATAESVALYDQAVRASTSATATPAPVRCGTRGIARFRHGASRQGLVVRAGQRSEHARSRAVPGSDAAGLTLNEREQAHLAALQQATAGARSAAASVLDRHLMRYPFDLVAHQAVTLLDGYLGRFRWVRDRTARALPFWSKDQPGYASILAFHGFGLEEAGDYARAEDESRAAAELEPHSFWPHHTVSHVMEMTGRPEDGLGWMIAREPFWSAPENVTQVHIWWHKSLFHLELGQYDAALALYDGPLLHTLRPLALNLCNASALLWRLDTLGCDVGHAVARSADAVGGPCRWQMPHVHRPARGDGRTAVRPGGSRRTAPGLDARDGSERRRRGFLLSRCRHSADRRPDGVPSRCLRAGGGAVAAGRLDLWRIGGSHAQRDIVDWTLTEAAVRGGMRDVALAMAYERLGNRPRSAVNQNFLRRAEMIAA